MARRGAARAAIVFTFRPSVQAAGVASLRSFRPTGVDAREKRGFQLAKRVFSCARTTRSSRQRGRFSGRCASGVPTAACRALPQTGTRQTPVSTSPCRCR
ncbi:MAG: hypothetical protein MZV64_48515 [Ignavibacteriales bacterium]|nr:hypothetical protein [Ignavibacteriales bacterium]